MLIAALFVVNTVLCSFLNTSVNASWTSCFTLITFLCCSRKAECNTFSVFVLPQAIERAPTPVSSAPDELDGPSGAAEQGLSESDSMEVRGGRFSKSAEERQKMLKQRKEELLQQARRLVQ